MEKSAALMGLTFVTLCAALVWGFYEVWAVKKSKQQGEHADGSKERPHA